MLLFKFSWKKKNNSPWCNLKKKIISNNISKYLFIFKIQKQSATKVLLKFKIVKQYFVYLLKVTKVPKWKQNVKKLYLCHFLFHHNFFA